MSKLQELKDAKLKATAAQLDISKMIKDAKATYDSKAAEIARDRRLSSEGRAAERDQIKEELKASIKKQADKLRTEYAEANDKARKLAREIMTENAHEKPSDSEIDLFKRDLTNLRTELMLETRYNSALEKIRSFESKYSTGYFASQLIDEMPNFISTVVGLAPNKDEARLVLKRMHTNIKDRSLTPEQKEASYLLESEQQAFISRAGMEHSILLELFGAHTAYTITQENE